VEFRSELLNFDMDLTLIERNNVISSV